MTAKEKQLVISILTKKIAEQSNLKIFLSRIKGYIEEDKSIPSSIYGNLQLKAWLKKNFSQEFYVSSSDELYYIGKDISEARSADVIEAILTDKLKSGEKINCSRIPSILEAYNGLHYQDFSDGIGMEEWIKYTFPSLDIQDRELIIKSPDRIVHLTKEYCQMEMIVKMEGFIKGLARVQKICDESLDVNAARNIIASSFWRAIIGKSILYCEYENDIMISFAFDSGILSENGNSILCVIETDKTRSVSQWKFNCLCCPQECVLPGDMHWLQQQIGAPRLKIAEIKEQLDLIDKQKNTTLASLKDFENQLDTGCIPDRGILGKVSSYIDLWDSLLNLLSSHGIWNNADVTLTQIQDFYDANSDLNDIKEKILTEFGKIVEFVDDFILNTLKFASEITTAKQDFLTFQTLLHKVDISGDFSGLIQILDNYKALRILMSAPAINDVKDSLACVYEHFSEMSHIPPSLLVGKSKDECAPILGIDSILNMIGTYEEILDKKIEDEAEITVDQLKEYFLKEKEESVYCIPQLLHDLLSADNSIREIIFAKDNTYAKKSDSTVEQIDYTPCSIGSRLYEAIGNKNQLAEKYFIIGLFFDKAQCGKQLLNIYREEDDFESFQNVWQYNNGLSYATEEDSVFLVSNYVRLSSDLSDYADDVSKIFKKYPSLFENPEFKAVYSSFISHLTNVPEAYKQWISHTNIVLNEFEQALADNNLDAIYSMLDKTERLFALGYSESEVDAIKTHLKKDFVTGLDEYSKGKRLLMIQGNKNSAAEKYFWQSIDKQAKMELVYIYYDRQDFSSVCWIVEQCSVDIGSQTGGLKIYSDSLINIGETNKLAKLAVRYPEIWYCRGVLELLATLPSACDFDWKKIHNWSVENPILDSNALERALIDSDESELKSIAESQEEMAELGYSEEQQQFVRQELVTVGAHSKTRDIAHKIYSLQENLHRTYESFLLSTTVAEHDWAISKLYKLYVLEQRFEDVVAYFNAYEHIRNVAVNVSSFLWSLIGLGKNEALLKYIQNNYVNFNQDEALLNKIVEIAEEEGWEKEIVELRRKYALVPENRFELNLINLNKTVLQEYVSSPESLVALGYDGGQIARITDAFKKLYMVGKEGYAVADRIRKFLGDERSEPYFIESETDPRSAKALFDIYFKQNRWDDLCDLYRRHDVITTWNNHYNSGYIKALSSAKSKNNCEAYLELLDNEQKNEFSEVGYAWVYLRTLLGAEKLFHAQKLKERILENYQEFSLSELPNFFNFTWNLSKETNKFIIRLIDDIINCWDIESFTSDEVRMIITANDHINFEGVNINELELFLHENQMEKLLFYLNIYCGLFITDRPDEKNQFYCSLIKNIDSFENTQINLTQLMPYFEACRHLDGQESIYEAYTEQLRTCFMSLVKSGKLFTQNDCNIILYIVNSGVFSPEQIFIIVDELCSYMSTLTENTLKNELTLFATNVLVTIIDNSVMNIEESEEKEKTLCYRTCNDIAEKWYTIIEDASTLSSDEEWNTFISFLKTPYIDASHVSSLAIAWVNKVRTIANDIVILSRVSDLVSVESVALPPDSLCDILVNILSSMESGNFNEETDLLISQYIKSVAWDQAQLDLIVEALQRITVFDCEKTNDAIESILEEKHPELYCAWIKKEIIFFTGNDDQQAKLFPKLLEYVKQQVYTVTDNDDYQLLYEAVCHNPTQSNLAFLYEVYKIGGKLEQASILEALYKDTLPENVNTIYNWLITTLNERSLEWIEHYSKWWQELIHLNDEDQRTKLAVAYLGLSDEPINETTLNSLSKLLMSDIYNVNYLKCYFRVMRKNAALNEAGFGTLSYLNAVADPTELVNSIRNCFNNKQYDLGMQLLRRKMEMRESNSSSAGQLLGCIYTPENLRHCDQLRECLPEVFDWIRKLNDGDPHGEWKNLGRAVDIAIITDNENTLLEKSQDVLFQQYTGRAAVVIASLIKKDKFDDAKKWLEKALQYDKTDYYAILEDVLAECIESQTLSKINKLKLATIPEDGNRRSFEFYGEFVFKAYEQGLKNECLSVMEYLYDTAQNDKAYFSTLISLCYLMPISTEYLIQLYNRIKAYFKLTQEENVVRVSRMLAILHACINVECEEKNESVSTFCMQARPHRGYKGLTDLESKIQGWIESSHDRNSAVQLIVNSISGHWDINKYVLGVLKNNTTVAEELVDISPEAFCAACVRFALQNMNKKAYLERIADVLRDYEQVHSKRSLSLIHELTDESFARILAYLDIPAEIPGAYFNIIKDTIDHQEAHSNEEMFERELIILFSLHRYFNYTQYNKNKYNIRDYVDAVCTDNNRRVVLLALSKINMYSMEADGKLLNPGQYLSEKDYLMVITSAEEEKKKIKPEQLMQKEIYDTYILLGKLMQGLLTPKEIGCIRLAQFLNMANLLCQNIKAYEDIDTLLSLCPAKWKICVRCLQELIQGKPDQILYVMKKDEFWKVHEGCASYVERMARDFVNVRHIENNKAQALLINESKIRNRDEKWGTINDNDIRSADIPYNTQIKLLFVQRRNPVEEIGSRFYTDIDQYLEQMVLEDKIKEKDNQNNVSDNSDTVKNSSETDELSENHIFEMETKGYDIPEEKDFRKLEFISEAIEKRKKNAQTKTDEEGSNNVEAIYNKTDEIVSKIESNWDNPNDELRRLCIELGHTLFNEYCERSGLKIMVTEKARDVLYQAASCVSRGVSKKALSAGIKTDVQLCIESYSTLSQLVEDCMKPALMDLCSLINDYAVRKAFVSHIEQVRQIGTLLSNPLMPAEKLAALEKQIRICRNNQSVIDSSLKYHLISLINKEISSFREFANVTIEVYNNKGAIEEGYIFGRIQNTGSQTVKNIQMELAINGIYDQTYILDYLEGKTMVPFALQYEASDDEKKMHYSLKAIYETMDNNKEETRDVTGTLELRDPEEEKYNWNASYQTGRPAGKEDYVERTKIQAGIDGLYSPVRGFESFPTLAIYGMRRTGKSSVMKKLERTLMENFGEEIYLVETSGEGTQSNDFADAVHSMLVCQILKNRGDGFMSLADCLSDNPEWQEFVEKWQDVPASSSDCLSDFKWIEDFYSELCNTFLQSKKLVIFIDEVDKLYCGIQDSQTNLWGILTRITQSSSNPFRFVFCGSDYFTNSMIDGDNLTQFFQKIGKIRIGRMTRNEWELALNSLLEMGTDITFHPDTIPYLWTICDGLSWHAKIIINDAIREKLVSEHRNIIYPSDVMFSADNILSSGLYSTENNFGVIALREEERLFVSILAKKSLTMNTLVSEEEIYQDFCKIMPDSDHKKSFDRARKLLLTERQLIVSREGPDGPKYRFACEMYRLYNRGEKFITQQFRIN